MLLFKHPKLKRALPWIAGAVLVAGGIALYVGHEHGGHDAPATDKRPAHAPDHLVLPAGAPQLAYIQTFKVADQPLPLTDPLNARIVLAEDRTARIFAPVAGRIVALSAQPGDKVAAGSALATVDAPDLGQAMADLQKAEADAARKRLGLERARTLLQGEVLPRREFEAAEADARAANAEAERARLRLANLSPSGKVNGQRLALRSPVAGTVIDRQANPGLEVRPDTQAPLFVVSDLSKLWLLIDLPEKELSKLALGDSVSVSVDAWPDTT
ncbi:MAG: efflux RND transporter periplasmic adaptor subunit, partial [Zoogloea sp.]|nr:efflux RND transporter periplasmic adaptor subunit [Zoogloea sp.]